MISDILRGWAVMVVWSPPSHLRLRAIMVSVIRSVKCGGNGLVCSTSLALTPLLRRLPSSHLRQGRIEVADVALRAHPALRTIDPLQVSGDELEELMRLAGRASDPHPASRSDDLSHPSDSTVRDADAITDLELFTHYNLLNPRFTALRSNFSGSNLPSFHPLISAWLSWHRSEHLA
jgi:hypothetical protein